MSKMASGCKGERRKACATHPFQGREWPYRGRRSSCRPEGARAVRSALFEVETAGRSEGDAIAPAFRISLGQSLLARASSLLPETIHAKSPQ